MNNLQPILLFDGPLWPGTPPSKRQRLVSDMAGDLLKFDSFRTEADAWASLVYSGKYKAFDLMVAIDDARQLAMQETVAKEMSDV